jgi:hypothetical protein
MAKRSSGSGVGAVFGLLLLVGLVIQVVKLLVVPLTILAIGAVVGVPIYLVAKNRRARKGPLPSSGHKRISEDDGIVSQEAILRFLPTDLAAEFARPQQDTGPSGDLRPSPDAAATPSAMQRTGSVYGMATAR